MKKEIKVFLSLGFKDRTYSEKEEIKENLKKGFKIKILDYLYNKYDILDKYDISLMEDSIIISNPIDFDIIDIKFIDNDIVYIDDDKNIRMFRKGMALQKISECDVVLYTKEDYEKYDGVKLEIDLCKKYDIDILKFDEEKDYNKVLMFGYGMYMNEYVLNKLFKKD